MMQAVYIHGVGGVHSLAVVGHLAMALLVVMLSSLLLWSLLLLLSR
jgi:hypothetical protein